MTDTMIKIIKNRQKCGELSRVIVDRPFRGTGISGRLITEALNRAVGKGINQVFLEWLNIHEQIYEKHGFKRLDGVEASVIDVKRTMIGMQLQLQPEAVAKITARLSDALETDDSKALEQVWQIHRHYGYGQYGH